MERQIPVGIPEFDRVSGGIPAGRTYVVTGGCGVGKSAISLTFLLEGLRRGEKCLHVASGRAEDIFHTAKSLRVDIDAYFEEDQLVAVYPVESFADLVAGNRDARLIADEIARSAEGRDRVVIESFSALLESRFPVTGNPGFLSALLSRLDDIPATVWIAEERGEQGNPYPWQVLERFAFGVFGLEWSETAGRSFRVRKLRGTAMDQVGFPFRFLPGGGVEFGASDPVEPNRSDLWSVFCLRSGDEEALDLDRLLGTKYRVTSSESTVEAVARVLQENFDLVILELREGSNAPFEVCSRLKESGIKAPVLFLGGRRMRALDRVRCFRVGGDEIVTRSVHPDEFRHRAGNLVRRGGTPGVAVDTSLAGQEMADAIVDARDASGLGPSILEWSLVEGDMAFTARLNERFIECLDMLASSKVESVAYVVQFLSADESNEISDPAPAEAARVVLDCCRNDDLIVGLGRGVLVVILVGTGEDGFAAFQKRMWARLREYFAGRIALRYRWGKALWSSESATDDRAAFRDALLDSFRSCAVLSSERRDTVQT